MSLQHAGRVLRPGVPRAFAFVSRLRILHQQRIQRAYAIGNPKDYLVSEPGDLVQLDTLDIRPLRGEVLKQLTARDAICRWDVLDIYTYTRAASVNTAPFLAALEERMPFPVKAIQVDGGSQFGAILEEECQKRRVRLFVLPSNSPKLNVYVERAHLKHTEEFCEVPDSSAHISALKDNLLDRERVYNAFRPRQSLGYLTSQEFLECYLQNKGVDVSLRYWTRT